MNEPSWRIARTVQGLDSERHVYVPVIVGLVETAAGVQVALRVGYERPVILALQDATQLALNLNETTAERLKITEEALGDEDQRRSDRP